ncbi:MAG: endonuclease/exonuclease/phosphatase family protein [Rhodospirillales bacterium]|nr:endonuclease/exonuclease/phosphatase family protein [Rhodospirillales bacterium]MDE2575203.1 endonuclease/exonuclease/phosphatase family protein [Rhodospirillales bacterium]
MVLALLVPLEAARAAPLKLATWNLEWLTARPAGDPALPADVVPKTAADITRLRRYADILAADVVAFEEVDGPQVAAEVFAPDRYVLHMTQDRVVQRVGLAVRRGIAFTANPDLTALDLYPHAHFPLRSGADITLHLRSGALRILAVHLKAGCRQDRLTDRRRPACATLGAQLPPLRAWIAARRAEGVAFVVMGDFNRWMDGRDRFWPALEQAATLRRATAGLSSPCWGGGGFIDHIIAGGSAIGWMRPDSLRVLVYRETGRAAKEHLSDHCPVSVTLQPPD